MSDFELAWERCQPRLDALVDQHAALLSTRHPTASAASIRSFTRDYRKAYHEAFKEGRVKGLREGAAQSIQLCERLLKTPVTPDEELLPLSLEELRARTAALEAQLGVASQ